MSVNECPLLHIELLEPIQPVPLPGELETFPHITLNSDNIVHVAKRTRTPRRAGARSGARLSRFRTQPITIAELAETVEWQSKEEEGEENPSKPPKSSADATSTTKPTPSVTSGSSKP